MNKHACAIILPFLLLTAAGAAAQTSSVQSTAEAYGARLNNPGQPAKPLNARRYNNRIDSRVESRISLRIERFRVGASADPLSGIRNSTRKSGVDAYRNVDGVGSRATLSAKSFNPPSSDVQMTDGAVALDEDESRDVHASH